MKGGRGTVLALLGTLASPGLEIRVDYRYDNAGFFDAPAARAAFEAAAARWSRIVDTNLLPANMRYQIPGTSFTVDGRIRIIHPGTGQIYTISSATDAGNDFVVDFNGPVADEYRGSFILEEDEYVVYVGARPLSGGDVARGGPTEAGDNLTAAYIDPNGFLNRGFNSGQDSLAVVGGFVTFNSNLDWNFDLSSGGGPGSVDLYSVALHEIGHTLGLNTLAVAEWVGKVSGNQFTGSNAVAAYNADHGTTLGSLAIVNESAWDFHWATDTYLSRIFAPGTPLLTQTVGAGNFQSLVMEPEFFTQGANRLEVTNVDAAALVDIGWSIISEDPPRPAELEVIPAPATNSAPGLSVETEVGALYFVQTSPDGVSWVDVQPGIVGDGNTFTWTDGQAGFTDPFGPAVNLSAKFYRIVRRD